MFRWMGKFEIFVTLATKAQFGVGEGFVNLFGGINKREIILSDQEREK